jgi:hypothetical protein
MCFPTDLGLLNDVRNKLDEMIDTLHCANGKIATRPRTYREKASKDYLAVSKQRKLRKNIIRQAIKKQLQYAKRNLGIVDRMLAKTTEGIKSLSRRYQELLTAIRELIDQQTILYKTKCHTASTFAASDEVLIVSDCKPFSMQNLNYLLRDLEAIQANGHPNLYILGILISHVDLQQKLSKKRILAAYRHTFGDVVFNSYISNDTGYSKLD